MAKRITTRLDTRRLAAVLALRMTVADLAARLRVIAEARAAGVDPRPLTGLSFVSVDPLAVDRLIRDPEANEFSTHEPFQQGGARTSPTAPPIFAEGLGIREFLTYTPKERTAPLSGMGKAGSSRNCTGHAGDPAVAAGRGHGPSPSLLDRFFATPPDDEKLRGARCSHDAPLFFAEGGFSHPGQPLAYARGSVFAEDGSTDQLSVSFLPSKIAPREALDFFRQRLAMTKVAFQRLSARYRAIAFTVAHVESVALIETLQKVLDSVIEEGQAFGEFKRRSGAAMRAAGVDPLKPWHLETVFRTNTLTAYQAGRTSMLLQADVRRALPWWQYKTVADDRVRRSHARLHNFVARHDDAVWKRVYPPNGFNCRCTVVALTNSQARERAGATEQDLSKTGRSRVPAGPDAGFDSSPWANLRERLAGAAR